MIRRTWGILVLVAWMAAEASPRDRVVRMPGDIDERALRSTKDLMLVGLDGPPDGKVSNLKFTFGATQQADFDVKQVAPDGLTLPLKFDARGRLAVKAGTIAVLSPKGSVPIANMQAAGLAEQVALYVAAAPGAPPQPFRMYLDTRQALAWDAKLKKYTAPVTVGVLSSDDVSEFPPAWKSGVTFQFSTKGAGASVDPSRVVVTRPGTEGFQDATLLASSLLDDLEVTALGGPWDKTCKVTSSPPTVSAISLSVTPARLRAFGLEYADVSGVCLTESGQPVPPAAVTEVVHLEAAQGRFSPGRAVSYEVFRSGVQLRSSSVGVVEVTARIGGVASPPRQIEYEWPWLFGVVTILAGAFGGLIRGWKASTSGRAIARAVVTGVFVGFVVVAAAVLGINVFEWAPPGTAMTEVGAALLSAVAGYLGLAVLDWFKTRRG